MEKTSAFPIVGALHHRQGLTELLPADLENHRVFSSICQRGLTARTPPTSSEPRTPGNGSGGLKESPHLRGQATSPAAPAAGPTLPGTFHKLIGLSGPSTRTAPAEHAHQPLAVPGE